MMAATARKQGPGRLDRLRDGGRKAVRRTGSLLGGGALIVVTLLALLALVTYHPSDPSPNTAAGGPVANWAGAPGAWLADILLSLFGPPVVLLLPLSLAIGLRLLRGTEPGRWGRSLFFTSSACR